MIRPPRLPIREIVILLLALAGAAPASATIIDSFTDPYPANPMLPVTGASVLFLGSYCDGATCPPGSVVQNPEFYDCAEQFGLPGTISHNRNMCIATYFKMETGDFGVVTIDPSNGGRLILGPRGSAPLELDPSYGYYQSPLNLVIGADGSDRIEIEILSSPNGPDAAGVEVGFWSFDATNSFIDDGALHEVPITGPGIVSIPYAAVWGLADLDDDVDNLQFRFIVRGDPAVDFVIGEIRTVGTPTAAEPASWGRIKGAYRR